MRKRLRLLPPSPPRSPRSPSPAAQGRVPPATPSSVVLPWGVRATADAVPLQHLLVEAGCGPGDRPAASKVVAALVAHGFCVLDAAPVVDAAPGHAAAAAAAATAATAVGASSGSGNGSGAAAHAPPWADAAAGVPVWLWLPRALSDAAGAMAAFFTGCAARDKWALHARVPEGPGGVALVSARRARSYFAASAQRGTVACTPRSRTPTPYHVWLLVSLPQ
jgi:hypothetical protein